MCIGKNNLLWFGIWSLLLLLLISCSKSQILAPSPTATNKPSVPTNIHTIPSPSPEPIKTANPENELLVYDDKNLCIKVQYPSSWNQFGESGAFAGFVKPTRSGSTYSITNVYLGESPSLSLALEDLKRGALSKSIVSVENTKIDQETGTFVTFNDKEFKFLVMIITPDCGTGEHSISIYSRDADRDAFTDFLNHIKFSR